MKKRLTAAILALVMLFSSCVLFRTSFYAASLNDQKNSLQSRLKILEKDKAAASSALAEAKKKANEQARVVELMYEEIDLCQQELDTLSELIEEYQSLKEEKEREIEEINKRMDRNFELFRRRLVFAQESGDMTLIDFILGSSDISDILSRSEQVNDMLEYDRKLIESLVSDRDEVEAAKLEIEEAIAKCAEQQEIYELKKVELQEKVDTANAYLAQLKEDQATQQLAYETVAKKQSDAEKELDRIQAQIKAENEAKARANASSGNNGGSGSGNTGTSSAAWRSNTWPVAGRCAISQYFKGSAHSGLDIHTYGANGTVPAVSVLAGTVVRTGMYASWGNLVVVQHDNGYQTYYAHLARILVSNGQRVSEGQTLGMVGTTGNSTGPHLHICVVTPAGVRVDPLPYLPSHN